MQSCGIMLFDAVIYTHLVTNQRCNMMGNQHLEAEIEYRNRSNNGK